MSKKLFHLILVFLLTMFCFTAAASATALLLPNDLRIIEEEAFYGACSFETVELPENVLRIESQAFAYSSIRSVHLPESLEYIADDAFLGCDNLFLTAPEGSYAYRWAKSNGYMELSVNVSCNTIEA